MPTSVLGWRDDPSEANMDTHRHRLLIGACGWEHPSWIGTFYPDDLPEDWRLTFYSNEFRLALVPDRSWEEEAHGPRQWLEACDDQFAFLTEVPIDLVRRFLDQSGVRDELLAWQQKYLALGRQWLGTLVHVPSEGVSEEALERLLGLLSDSPCVCLDAAVGAARDAAGALARRLEVGLVWDGEGTDPAFGGGELAVTRLRRVTADLRSLRRVVEGACAPGEAHRTAALVVDTDPANIELMRQAEVIANLL